MRPERIVITTIAHAVYVWQACVKLSVTPQHPRRWLLLTPFAKKESEAQQECKLLTHRTKAGTEAQTGLCPFIPQAFPTSQAEKIGREERPNEDGLGAQQEKVREEEGREDSWGAETEKTGLPRCSPSLKTPLTEKHSNVF